MILPPLFPGAEVLAKAPGDGGKVHWAFGEHCGTPAGPHIKCECTTLSEQVITDEVLPLHGVCSCNLCDIRNELPMETDVVGACASVGQALQQRQFRANSNNGKFDQQRNCILTPPLSAYSASGGAPAPCLVKY